VNRNTGENGVSTSSVRSSSDAQATAQNQKSRRISRDKHNSRVR